MQRSQEAKAMSDFFLRVAFPVLLSTISMSTPLILAALGGVFSVRGGIMALGLESMMMTGAFCAVLGAYFTGNAWIGVVCGVLGGMLLGLLHGVLCIRYKVNQVISGIGLNLLALAATTLLMQLVWKNRGSSVQVTALEYSGRISPLFYLTLVLVALSTMVLFKTRFGLRLRMVGEHPQAAASMGIRVHGYKYVGVLICGALAGLGGTYLSLNHLNMFVRDMTAGRGYIAVVINILARYTPLNTIWCAFIFGFSDAVQIIFQGRGVPPQLVQSLPYVVTLVVLAFGVKHITPPAGVGKSEDD
jgi:general nucleoside transport system permease protein